MEIERPDTVGICDRCGREFFTMPKHGLDRWGMRRFRDKISTECGGRVQKVLICSAPSSAEQTGK